MEIEKIKGHSYFIRGGTNSGVYIFKDKYALIIDPGLSNSRANRIIKYFEEKGLKIKFIINTHEHSDHFGASKALKEYYTGARTYASQHATTFIHNPHLFSTYVYGGKANEYIDDFFKNREFDICIDEILKAGDTKFNNDKFDIIDLKGHSLGQIGILTSDKVLYLGDSLFNENILEKYNFPFLFDIKEQLYSLEKISSLDFEYAVLSHGKPVLNAKETQLLIIKNQEVIHKYLNQIREFLNTPYTREELLTDIIQYNNLKLNYKEYYFSNATLGSMISYLIELKELDYEIENGKLYYYLKR